MTNVYVELSWRDNTYINQYILILFKQNCDGCIDLTFKSNKNTYTTYLHINTVIYIKYWTTQSDSNTSPVFIKSNQKMSD